jgi:hypothetical protein
MIPVVCVMEWILHSKHYSREVKMSVMVVVIGVGVCTVTDVNVNLKGFVCASLAVVSSSLQQIVSVYLYNVSVPPMWAIWNLFHFLLRFHFLFFCHLYSSVVAWIIEKKQLVVSPTNQHI